MSKKLQGAYVQAWVWVFACDLVPGALHIPMDMVTEEQWRNKAKEMYEDEGAIEIDENAEVSVSEWEET